MERSISLTLLLLFLLGCGSDGILPSSRFNGQNTVDLGNPQVGQKTYFQGFITLCESLEEDFEYTGDTLILEVFERENEYFFGEYFTPHSGTYLDSQVHDTTYYPFKVAESFILLPERSRSTLFFFYGNDTLRLNPPSRAALVQEDCYLQLEGEVFDGDEIGKVRKIELGEIKINDKTAVSCIPLIFDLDAYLVYDSKELHLSYSIPQVPGPQISGFVRM